MPKDIYNLPVREMLERSLNIKIDEQGDDWLVVEVRGQMPPRGSHLKLFALLETPSALPEFWRDNIRYECKSRGIVGDAIQFSQTSAKARIESPMEVADQTNLELRMVDRLGRLLQFHDLKRTPEEFQSIRIIEEPERELIVFLLTERRENLA